MSILNQFRQKAVEPGRELLSRYLSVEMAKGLREGKLIVKSHTLRAGIERALAAENDEDKAPDVCLEELFCTQEDMLLKLKTTHKGSQISLILHIQVLDVLFNEDEQSVHMRVTIDKPLGNNILGKVACAVASSIVNQMVSDAIATNKLVSEVKKDGEKALLVDVDLSNVEMMQTMSRPLPIINKSPLAFITLHSICHDPRGLVFSLGKV